jgi:hypothetical protein
MQDRCTVCVKRTIDSEFFLCTTDGTPTRHGSSGNSFWSACKIGARFATNVPRARKSFWAHPIVLLGDVGQVKARFGPFGDSVKLGARLVYGLR